MSDLRSFARDTERSVDQLPFDVMIAGQRRARRRRALVAVAAAVAAVLALTLALAGLSQLRRPQIPSERAPKPAPSLDTGWSADDIIGHPSAAIVKQLGSRTDPRTLLTVWKRCLKPTHDNDCLGQEAIAVVDGSGHRLVTLGAVTDSLSQPSRTGDGLLREVGDGLWYWAHEQPGPYLLSATMTTPVPLTVMNTPVTHNYGVSSIECADQVGLCSLNVGAHTLERLAVPDLPDTRWATPTAQGCGLWGLSGVGTRTRLVIQQRDGSFASTSLAGRPLLDHHGRGRTGLRGRLLPERHPRQGPARREPRPGPHVADPPDAAPTAGGLLRAPASRPVPHAAKLAEAAPHAPPAQATRPSRAALKHSP